MEFLFVIVWFAVVAVGMVWLFYGKSGLSLVDQTRCQNDGEKMRASGYIAHGFKRSYVCPLCNWDTYVDDPELKRQKLERIDRERATPTPPPPGSL